jgi:hypothetical protein
VACDVKETIFVDEADDLLCEGFFDAWGVDVGYV